MTPLDQKCNKIKWTFRNKCQIEKFQCNLLVAVQTVSKEFQHFIRELRVRHIDRQDGRRARVLDTLKDLISKCFDRSSKICPNLCTHKQKSKQGVICPISEIRSYCMFTHCPAYKRNTYYALIRPTPDCKWNQSLSNKHSCPIWNSFFQRIKIPHEHHPDSHILSVPLIRQKGMLAWSNMEKRCKGKKKQKKHLRIKVKQASCSISNARY